MRFLTVRPIQSPIHYCKLKVKRNKMRNNGRLLFEFETYLFFFFLHRYRRLEIFNGIR